MMCSYTLQEICAAVKGTLLQPCGGPLTAVTTDSRKAAPGQLFIPLAGERFDGHDYLDSALNGGADACLTARQPETMLPGKGYVLVGDTMLALKDLAAWHREHFRIPVIQVTGSAGKTTTKEMIACVLGQRFRTHKTHANLNNQIGTPLTLLELSAEDRAAVIETGMDHFGEIRYMGQMVQPDVAVITNVGDAHVENLGNTRLGVLQAKCEIFENLRPGGVAVLNGDDELLRNITVQDNDIIFCGRGENCAVRVTEAEELGIDGLDPCDHTRRLYGLSGVHGRGHRRAAGADGEGDRRRRGRLPAGGLPYERDPVQRRQGHHRRLLQRQSPVHGGGAASAGRHALPPSPGDPGRYEGAGQAVRRGPPPHRRAHGGTGDRYRYCNR